jgi:hypothetical protein
MATLNEIEEFLNIDTTEKPLYDGKKKKDKNQYYRYHGEYYIIKLTHEMWMIADDSLKTRQLLKNHIFHCGGENYTSTRIGGYIIGWHRLSIDCDDNMIPDHINRKKFDNRTTNLREVTRRINARNMSIREDNKIGMRGIDICVKNGYNYVRVQITDNKGERIERLFSIDKMNEDEAIRHAKMCRKRLQIQYNYLD